MERPYKCETCGKAFDDPSNLARHRARKHTVERPFECDHCQEAFITASYLEQHMASHVDQTLHTSGPESEGPQQWVVVKGQCVPIKQELDDHVGNYHVKQENHDT